MVPLLDRSWLKILQNNEIQIGHNIDVYTLFAMWFYSLVSTIQLMFSISSYAFNQFEAKYLVHKNFIANYTTCNSINWL